MLRTCSFVVAALLGAAAPGLASTFLYVTPEELVDSAEAVVEGVVVEAHSYWNAERTAILTDAVLQVNDTLVGVAEPFVNLRTFGGRVGDYKIVAHGFPSFAVGDRLVVFLEPEREGAYRVAGYLQGQFRVEADAQGQLVAVPQTDTGSRYLTKDGQLAPAPRTRPLAELAQQLREVAERAGSRPAVR